MSSNLLGPKTVNLSGQKFGRLTVVRLVEKTADYATVWECVCECGTVKTVDRSNLTSGRTKSCGCLNSEVITKRNTSHGKSRSPTYKIWTGMIQRCTNPKVKSYEFYGANGITVCDKWLKSFEDFESDMKARPKGKTIERIDTTKGYCPENCRWATRTEQARNKSNNRYITIGGQTKCISEWAHGAEISPEVLWHRIDNKWSEDRLLKPAGKATTRLTESLVGRTFSFLTVLEQRGVNIHRTSMWLCRCVCGVEKTISRANLITGNTKSCGCKFVELHAH